MKRTVHAVLAGVLVSLGVGLPAWAHHSFAAAYDTTKTITIQGVIVQVRLENPHSWFFLDVKDATGKVVRWSIEAGTPSGMLRNGYKPNLIKAGTEVTITGSPAKDPTQNIGMLRELKTADGKTYGMFGPQESPK